MADPTQFTFELQEVAAALVKQQGLHDGTWMLGFEFGMGATMGGATPAESVPLALLQVLKIQLVKQPPGPLQYPRVTVNAAEINPVKSAVVLKRNKQK